MVLLVITIILIISAIISWRWVVGIDFMSKNHSDYKGNDLFGEWDDDDKTQIG